MQRAIALLFVAVLMVFAGVAFAADDLTSEPAEFQSHVYVNHGAGAPPATPVISTDVYSNVASAANFGFSSTSLVAQWGDRCTTTGIGMLSEHVFTIFNAGTSAGNLLTANVTVSFFDAVTSAPLGAYATSVNFGAGLTPGFFSLVTVTGLDPLLINLNVTDVIVIQTVTAKTGPANRLGIASLNPVTLGSSTTQMYINASTVGPPGFYNIGTAPNFMPAHPGYRIGVTMAPVATETKTWGSIKALYR